MGCESFLEGSHGDRVSVVSDEPGHRALHHYAGLNFPVGYASRKEPIDTAVTKMLRSDYSQLPVVQSEVDGAVVGVFSWETYARARLRGEDPKTVESAMEPVATVDLHSDLFASVGPIAQAGFVVVSYHGALSGIVTASDLTMQFQQLAVPFLAVGRCEQELKRVAKLCLKHWDMLGWSLSPDDFLEWLNTTRNLRNSIAHFDNQDADRSVEVHDVNRLTEWLRLVFPERASELDGRKPR